MHTPILHKADASSSAQNTPSKLNNSLTLKAALGAAFLLCGEKRVQTKSRARSARQ